MTNIAKSLKKFIFNFVVQFRRIRAEHLWCQISSSSTKLSLSASNGSYCTRIIVGSRVMLTHLLPYTLIIALWGQWNMQCSELGCRLCFSVGYYSTWLWIRLSILSCGAIPQDSCRSLIFSLRIGGEIMWQLFFWITQQFLLWDATEQI